MRRLTPYLLLALLVMGSGLAIGLGLSETPVASSDSTSANRAHSLEPRPQELTGSITFDFNGVVLLPPPKGAQLTGKSRVVSLPHFLTRMLTEHLDQYPADEGFVFTAAEGGPIRHRNFYRRHFRPAVERAGRQAIEEGREDDLIPEGLRFHDLRHTCAAILIANGRHIEEVRNHLGHSSIRTSQDAG